jgi:hypothetical protein
MSNGYYHYKLPRGPAPQPRGLQAYVFRLLWKRKVSVTVSSTAETVKMLVILPPVRNGLDLPVWGTAPDRQPSGYRRLVE